MQFHLWVGHPQPVEDLPEPPVQRPVQGHLPDQDMSALLPFQHRVQPPCDLDRADGLGLLGDKADVRLGDPEKGGVLELLQFRVAEPRVCADEHLLQGLVQAHGLRAWQGLGVLRHQELLPVPCLLKPVDLLRGEGLGFGYPVGHLPSGAYEPLVGVPLYLALCMCLIDHLPEEIENPVDRAGLEAGLPFFQGIRSVLQHPFLECPDPLGVHGGQECGAVIAFDEVREPPVALEGAALPALAPQVDSRVHIGLAAHRQCLLAADPELGR